MPHSETLETPPAVGMVSLGCPKALVDSERILTRLRADGYQVSPDYAGADVVLVNTCGFLDSARDESLDAIGEALAENGRVIVTGCLGHEADLIRQNHPEVLAVTGPQQYEEVVAAVRAHAPPPSHPFQSLVPPQGLRLTPRHYAYVKISEGCNHKCRFCIIPQMRGKLASRPAAAVLREAQQLADAGVKELLVISQDTSAYGRDLRHAETTWRETTLRAHVQDLAEALSNLPVWTRLHYVYPYKHVDDLIPLMCRAEDTSGLVPYLDIPFQHAHPETLKRMARPAASEQTLDRLHAWRAVNPDLAIRSTFITGYPGETDAEFEFLMEWLAEARLDRVGCFVYENVEGAAARSLPDHVPPELAEERRARLMALSARISAEKLAEKVGRRVAVLVDEVLEDGSAVGRTVWDAPEVDGVVRLPQGEAGAMTSARITASDAHDLTADLP